MKIVFTLKELLKEKGITQKQLSEIAGIRLATLSDICNNKIKHVPVCVLELICDYVGCSLSDFMVSKSE